MEAMDDARRLDRRPSHIRVVDLIRQHGPISALAIMTVLDDLEPLAIAHQVKRLVGWGLVTKVDRRRAGPALTVGIYDLVTCRRHDKDARGDGRDDAGMHRLARQCLVPLEMVNVSATLYDEVLDRVQDAMRGAYERGISMGEDSRERLEPEQRP